MKDTYEPTPSIENPDVRPAPLWTWSGFWSLILLLLEQISTDLAGIENPPRWLSVVVVALPFLIRMVRQKVTGLPSSYRRDPAP